MGRAGGDTFRSLPAIGSGSVGGGGGSTQA